MSRLHSLHVLEEVVLRESALNMQIIDDIVQVKNDEVSTLISVNMKPLYKIMSNRKYQKDIIKVADEYGIISCVGGYKSTEILGLIISYDFDIRYITMSLLTSNCVPYATKSYILKLFNEVINENNL